MGALVMGLVWVWRMRWAITRARLFSLDGLGGARVFALAGGEFHCVDDLGISAAAAEIAGEIVPNLILVGLGISVEELCRHQQKARRAVAALERARLAERLLHGAPCLRATLGNRPDRLHLGTIDKGGQVEAAGDSFAVHQHGAAAAHSLPTALAPAHQSELALQRLAKMAMR